MVVNGKVYYVLSHGIAMKQIIFTLMIACLLAFASCTETSGTDVQNGEQGTDMLTENPEGKPSSEENSGSALDELSSLFDIQKNLEYMVEYEMTTKVMSEETSGVMTQYVKGSKMRMDFAGDGTESRTILLDNSIITCSKDGEWMCFLMDSQEDSSFNPDEFRQDIESEDDVNVRMATPRTIAGKLAACFVINMPDSTTEYCLSKEAVPLYIKSEIDDYMSEMTATKFSTSVSDSAFEPPAEPTDYGEMLDGLDLGAYT